jgi:outer membrane protein OmpA-like peptidoglycan-associated protein
MGADDDSNVAITPEAVFFVGGNEASKASFAPEGREVSIDLTPGTKGVLQIRFKLNFFIDNSAPFTNTAYEKWVYTEWPVEVSPLGELTISDPSPTRDSGDVPQNAQLYLGSVGLSKGTNYVQAQISLVNSTSSNFGVSGGAGLQGGVNFIAQGAISGNLGAQWGQSYSTGSPRPQDFKVNITVPAVNLQSGPVPVFGINRSTLREGAEEAIVQWYQGLPEAARKKIEAGALPIDVIGRASKTGPGPMNRELSRKRANKVAEILRDYAGSDAKIRVFARGEYEAAGEGEDASDRVVDIRVHSPTGG